MDHYTPVLREFFRLLGQLWLERLAVELQFFAEALDTWLHALFLHPTPAWRESFEQFLAEQEAAGRIAAPESRRDLEDFLEQWAETIDSQPSPAAVPAAKPEHAPSPEKPGHAQVGRGFQRKSIQREVRESFFNQKLAQAKRHLEEMETVLAALGRKLDAAQPDETVEVEAEVDAIEALIWRHNDALESARDAWLRDNLGSSAFDRLMLMSSPAAFNLPLYADLQQAKRAGAQWKQIAQRLDQRIGTLDRIIFSMQVAEAAGTAASLALGGGVVFKAVQQGGKWAVVKTVARVAASGAAAHIAGKAVEHGLRAAGASEETIHGVSSAAELVTWLLLLRRVRRAGVKGQATPRERGPKHEPPTRPLKPRQNPLSSDEEVQSGGSEPEIDKAPGPHSSTYIRGRYGRSASDPGAYWDSGRRVFPTRRNSGLSGAELRAEQERFFLRGLKQGMSPGQLRGQAAEAGYERRGGITAFGGPDRLADKGAERSLQRAIEAHRKTD